MCPFCCNYPHLSSLFQPQSDKSSRFNVSVLRTHFCFQGPLLWNCSPRPTCVWGMSQCGGQLRKRNLKRMRLSQGDADKSLPAKPPPGGRGGRGPRSKELLSYGSTLGSLGRCRCCLKLSMTHTMLIKPLRTVPGGVLPKCTSLP